VIPFLRLEWTLEWIAYALDRWSFLKVLERLGSFSVLIAVIFYFSDAGNRIKQRHYQAWQVINTAQGQGGNGGRIEAMQELNADGVPLCRSRRFFGFPAGSSAAQRQPSSLQFQCR